MGDGACLIQMKYYLRGKEQQAYYFAKSDNKQACGREEDALTLERAKNKAKQNCEKMAKEKKITSECRLIAENFEIIEQKSNSKKSMKDFKHAIYKANIKKVKEYIALGYDVNTISTKDSITPLFVAAAKGDKEFFFQLLDKKSNINHISKDGSTLLHASIFGKNIEITKYLLKQKFDINKKGFKGNTPLHIAYMSLNKEMVKLLTNAGADKTIKNDKGVAANDLFKMMDINTKDLISQKYSKSKTKTQKIDMHKPLPLNETLQITANTLNKTLPTMQDEETRLDQVTTKGTTMTFHYTLVHFTPASMPARKLKSLMYEDIKTQVCTDNDTKMLLKKGMEVYYKYKGKNKKDITTFIFDAKTCGMNTHAKRLIENLNKLLKEKR